MDSQEDNYTRKPVQDEEEKADFEKLVHDLETEYAPVGIFERKTVREIAVCMWNIGIVGGWLIDDISA